MDLVVLRSAWPACVLLQEVGLGRARHSLVPSQPLLDLISFPSLIRGHALLKFDWTMPMRAPSFQIHFDTICVNVEPFACRKTTYRK